MRHRRAHLAAAAQTHAVIDQHHEGLRCGIGRGRTIGIDKGR
jgi:hypothetical protein